MNATPNSFLQTEVERIEAVPYEHRAAALIEATKQALGYFTEPGKSSHLYELTHYCVHARADNPDELVVNWLRVAKNLLKSLDPRENPELEAFRLDQLVKRARALATIGEPEASPAAILEACELILQTSGDAFERLVATEVQARTRTQIASVAA